MTILTFEEWRDRNQDLEDELRSEMHPAGMTMGELADIGAEDAGAYIAERMRVKYEIQVKLDAQALKNWNMAMQEYQG